jgi:hypothetical protein
MKINALQDRLQKYNVKLAGSHIRKLAHDGVITSPPRYHRKEKMGKGGPSNWSEESLADIVAFWYVTNDEHRGVVPTEVVILFRDLWDMILHDPQWVELMLHRAPDGNWSIAELAFLTAFEGKFYARYDCDSTFARWMALREKVLNDLPIQNPISLTYSWRIYVDANDEAHARLDAHPKILKLNEPDYRQDRAYIEFALCDLPLKEESNDKLVSS